ncbi:MAG: ASKHA domain-containing protein [Oscillospiraceae bacterium]|nr:ASKHA domain-containing protein [Oscillospiraceae bacterium]MDD4414831.1 ASKHA domain-containing protein [Oscillospiraceae bacterium]
MKQSVLKVAAATGQGENIIFDAPALLSELLAQNGIAVEMPCGGRQKCLKCKVMATGELSPMSEKESFLLTDIEKSENIRYACMTEALGDVRVRLMSAELYKDDILTDGYLPRFEPEPWGNEFGIAVDIGTTTVAAYLYRLSDGKLLKTLAEKNSQSVFGADVISRLQKSIDGQAAALASSIRGCISRLIVELCKTSSVPVEKVDSLVLTGNTAMLYLLCERDPSSITTAPFEQDCYFGMFVKSQELDLPLNAKVYLPRCISAYIGADITTALMASEFVCQGKVTSNSPRLFVDIGTNGEMALAADGMLWCCSTAAGPAFEGAGIYQGIPARTGAISQVKLENNRIVCSVLGGGQATGVCGSGLLDAVSVMLEAGIIDETGMICGESHAFTEYISEINDQPAFRLPDTRVFLTQQDIRSVQLAKSAICAGMLTLIKEAEYSLNDIKQLVIAGGFGNNINVNSAEEIGLIPPGFADKAYSVGNAAGAGAIMILLSDTIRRQSEQIGSLTKSVELSTNPFFMETYIDGMMFQNNI